MTVPFHDYLAGCFLDPLPWKRKFIVIGQRVCNALDASLAVQRAHVCAAAIGRARPELVPRLLESFCGPGTWQALFAEACGMAQSRIERAGGSPKDFEQLLPMDRTGLAAGVAPLRAAYALARGCVVEGLAFGREHPELTASLLAASFRSAANMLDEFAAPLPPEMKMTLKDARGSFEDFERHLVSHAAAWEAAEESKPPATEVKP